MIRKHTDGLELMLFESCSDRVREMKEYGVGSVLVDWEDKGKACRQKGYDTEIAPATREELYRVARFGGVDTWCRLNRYGTWTVREVEEALEAGVRGLFLPMVTDAAEVEAFLKAIDGRCEAGILIETVEAAALSGVFARLPLERVYFGLNDFSISRRDRCLFQALYDGTVERVRAELGEKILFGFGGATAVESGAPVPARYLLQEMARLKCSFTFLRRSFKRDLATRSPKAVVGGIQMYWRRLLERNDEEEAADYGRLMQTLERIC